MYIASYPALKANRAVNPSKTPGQTTQFEGSWSNSRSLFPPVSGEHAPTALRVSAIEPIVGRSGPAFNEIIRLW